MADVKLTIDISTGIWAIDVYRGEDDRFYDLFSPSKYVNLDLPDDDIYAVFINISAPENTTFKIIANEKVIGEGKTDNKNLFTGRAWIQT